MVRLRCGALHILGYSPSSWSSQASLLWNDLFLNERERARVGGRWDAIYFCFEQRTVQFTLISLMFLRVTPDRTY